MTVEANLVGVRCNLSCTYCYQNPMRDAGNFGPQSYDLDAMMRSLDAEGADFIVFGGEALLAPIEDLERLWAYGLQKHGKNGIQTNAVLITDAHIELFIKYRVSVGISVDGPDELNDSRWAGSLEKTREATAKSFAAIDKLLAAGVVPSFIVTLYRGNAVGERLTRLLDWCRSLDARGVPSMRLHLLEVDHADVAAQFALTDDENIAALRAFDALQAQLKALRFDIFADVERLLTGDDSNVTCVWNACDPYTTSAVRGVAADGTRSNCGRTNKEGINWLKGERTGFERQLVLYHTPQSAGGCAGCRFFFSCKGECPGTAIDGDWRNRTSQCKVWYAVHEMVEERLLQRGTMPLSLSHDRAELEQAMLTLWSRGQYARICSARDDVKQSLVNTHGDAPHGDIPHGDIPHGDGHGDAPHGDHTDA